jgi:hypothetical protein
MVFMFLFINYACLAEKQQIPIVQFSVWPGLEHTIYCAEYLLQLTRYSKVFFIILFYTVRV